MARTKQRLINYHTSKKAEMPIAGNVDYGEIVVRHNAENPELLIKVGDDSFGVFQASGAVKTAINSAVSTAKSELNTNISNLESKVDKFSGATVAEFTSLKTYADDTFATKTALQTAQTNITNAYTKAVGDAKVEIYNSATTFATNAVNTAKTVLDGNISSLETSLTGHVATFNTFKGEVEKTYATKAELKSTSGSIITAYEKAVGDAKVEIYNSATTFATNVKNELNGTISTVKNNLETLSGVVESISTNIGDNYVTTGKLSTTVETLENKILAAKSDAIASGKTYTDAQITAAKEYSDGKLTAATESLKQTITDVDNKVTTLSGNVHTTITNVQTALTETINNKVSKVYRYKGSRAYAALPTTGNVIGDVWNVTDANGNFPAGTNYAWTGTEWDALGGSVDLTPYAKTTYVDSEIKKINQTNTNLQSAIDSVSSATKTLVNEVSAATKATYATKTELQTAQNNITTAYTNAIGSAKDEVYTSATTFATNAVNTAKNALNQSITGLSSNVTDLSASTVSIKATADSAVQTATVNSGSGAKVTKKGTSLDFDFSGLIIDCGDF